MMWMFINLWGTDPSAGFTGHLLYNLMQLFSEYISRGVKDVRNVCNPENLGYEDLRNCNAKSAKVAPISSFFARHDVRALACRM